MVATRGGTQTDPNYGAVSRDAGASLRKKPVRRVVVNSASNKPKETSSVPTSQTTKTSGRETRATSATTSSQNKATTTVVRSRKDESANTTSKQDLNTIAEEPRWARSTRAASRIVTPVPDSLPQESKTTRRTRAATQIDSQETLAKSQPSQPSEAAGSGTVRRTRAAKTASQPLSPKKITQLSTRTTRNASHADPEKKATRTAARDKSTTRDVRSKRKQESDENADRANDSPTDRMVATKTPVKVRQSKRLTDKREPTPVSRDSLSTRSTTPSDSPMFSLSQSRHLTEDKAKDIPSEDEALDKHSTHTYPQTVSEDELAGPKTPMWRGNRQSSAVQRAAEGHTRNASSNSHNTRSSARNTQQDHACDQRSSRSASLDIVEESIVVLDDLSTLEEAALAETAETVPAIIEESFPEPPAAQVSIASDSFALSTSHNDESEEAATIQNSPATLQAQPYADEPAGSPTHSARELDEQLDADETILVEDDSEAENSSSSSSISNHSVVITRQDNPDEDEEMDYDDDYTRLTLTAKTPRPQTINWDSIQPSTIVRANLQMPISPQIDQSQLGPMPDVALSSPTKQEIAAQVESTFEIDDTVEFTEFVALPVPQSPNPDAKLSASAASSVVSPEIIASEDDVLIADPSQPADASSVSSSRSHITPGDEVSMADLPQPIHTSIAVSTQMSPASEDDVFSAEGSPPEDASSAASPQMSIAPEDDIFTTEASPSANTSIAASKEASVAPEDNQITTEASLRAETNNAFSPQILVAPEDDVFTADNSPSAGEPIQQTQTQGLLEDGSVTTRDTTGQPTEPHYMQPTIAFEARRNSLAGSISHLAANSNSRPGTSDSADRHSARPFEEPWWTRARQTPKPATPADKPSISPVSARRSLAPFIATTPKSRPSAIPATTRSARVTTPNNVESRLSRRLAHAKTVATSKYSNVSGSTAVDTTNRNKLRRLFTKDGTPAKSPARTPLRTIMTTPRFTAMTPLLTVPLRGVVAIVEVYTLEGASASAPFIALLHRLGAKTTKIWGDRVTHVVFKDGSPTILQRVFLHNKNVKDTGTGRHIHCVNSRWVSDCDAQATQVSELDEAYIVNTGEFSASSKRKRKSMEPNSVFNVDGNLVQSRKNSWGRSTSGRFLGSPLPSDSPAGAHTLALSRPGIGRDSASPATPDWIAAPSRLVQATAPLKRIRRLETVDSDQSKARRRTIWNNE